MTSFYTEEELALLGLKSYGKDVLISRKTSIYTPHKISIGDNVRIDDFCILSGDITLGSHIHIAAYSALYGAYGINLDSFSQISFRVTIFSATDDFSGQTMVGPCIPDEFRGVTGGKVCLKKHVCIGAGSVICPNLSIEEGTSVGAMSLVNRSLPPWSIYVGAPCRCVDKRSNHILTLEEKFNKTIY